MTARVLVIALFLASGCGPWMTEGVAETMFPLLGTPDEDKRLVVFPDVAHSCHDENPELFVETVRDFIEAYR